MLVISQKVGDRFQIGSGITVSVLSVKGGKVRLGIDAPQSVKVQRLTAAGRKRFKSESCADRGYDQDDPA